MPFLSYAYIFDGPTYQMRMSPQEWVDVHSLISYSTSNYFRFQTTYEVRGAICKMTIFVQRLFVLLRLIIKGQIDVKILHHHYSVSSTEKALMN